MENSDSDFSLLVQRVERLERKNRRMRMFCLVLLAAPALALSACVARTASVVEAQKLILRDKNGKARVEIGMSYDSGPRGYPVIRLFDEKGKELTTIGAGTIGISGDNGSATLLADTLQFSKHGVGLVSASLQDGTLFLYGKNGTMMLDPNTPVLEIFDTDGFRADLGRSDLTTERNGERASTSAASLVMSDKKGNVIWRTP